MCKSEGRNKWHYRLQQKCTVVFQWPSVTLHWHQQVGLVSHTKSRSVEGRLARRVFVVMHCLFQRQAFVQAHRNTAELRSSPI